MNVKRDSITLEELSRDEDVRTFWVCYTSPKGKHRKLKLTLGDLERINSATFDDWVFVTDRHTARDYMVRRVENDLQALLLLP